jgi:hypothetical protein
MGRGHALALIVALSADCGRSQTVAFDLVHLEPSPFQGLSRVEMIVGIGSGESVTGIGN